MLKVRSLSDPQYVIDQYKEPTNLNSRLRLHQLFSTNKYGWYRWLFDQFNIPPRPRILELGCGAGDLWLSNLDRVPADWDIVLSDFSAGMVKEAQKKLANCQRVFQYKVFDAASIPYDNNSFNIIIANHMLYHVPNKIKALSEIRRVMDPSGIFYASTIGRDHLKEIGDLLSKFDPQLDSWNKELRDDFVLENGSAQLSKWFSNINIYRFSDSLVITDVYPLMDYILSGRIQLTDSQKASLLSFLTLELSITGSICVTKDSGLFESQGTTLT